MKILNVTSVEQITANNCGKLLKSNIGDFLLSVNDKIVSIHPSSDDALKEIKEKYKYGLNENNMLEIAKKEYPLGTRFTSTQFFDFTSTGEFMTYECHFHKSAHKDSIWRKSEIGEPAGLIYDGETKEWAKKL